MSESRSFVGRLLRRKPIETLVSDTAGSDPEHGHLRRGITPFQLTMFGVGSTIGTGITAQLWAQDAEGALAMEATAVLRDCGNLSSPSVLLAAEKALASRSANGDVLISFGAGFACHSCRLS